MSNIPSEYSSDYWHYHDDINSWDGSNKGPNIGAKDNPTSGLKPTYGYNNSTPNAVPLNVAASTDFTTWDWEQVLNGVLGLQLPGRGQVTASRWTLGDSNEDDDHNLFKIFGAAWKSGFFENDNKDYLVYLNPALQTPGGPWDAYYSTPFQQLATAIGSPGGDWTNMAVDPKTFWSASVAMNGVQDFYFNAANQFSNITLDLNSEAGQFKGAAGDAFYQLMGNLNSIAQQIYSQINPPGPSYGEQFFYAGNMVWNTVVGAYNAYVDWITNALDSTPLGAIFQALEDGGVVSGDGNGNFTLTTNILAGNSFGNMLTDTAWQAVETAAKSLWNQSVAGHLDTAGQNLVSALANSYFDLQSTDQPLTPPTMTQISPPNVGSNMNIGDGGLNGLGNILGKGFGGLGNMFANGIGGLGNDLGGLGNMFGSGFNGLGDGLGGLGNDLSSGFNGLGNGLGSGFNSLGGGISGLGSGLGSGFNSLGNSLLANPNGVNGGLGGLNTGGGGLDSGLGGLNTGAGGLNPASELATNPGGLGGLNTGGGGLSTGLGGLNTPGGVNGLNTPSELLASPGGLGGLNTPGGLSTGLGGLNPTSDLANNPAGTSAIESALGDAQDEQHALQNALALAPSSGPLHNALETALADNGAEQDALQSALNGQTPAGAALQSALADNGNVGSALKDALNSGQVPATGALRNALNTAVGDNKTTGAALHNALSAAVPGGSQISGALADAGKTQKALQTALAQAPATGPVHNALETALANNKKEQAALHSAMDGNPAALQNALADNSKVKSALQSALAQAPSSGPLHNSLESALGNADKTGNAIDRAEAAAVPGGGQLQSALGDNSSVESALRHALASGQVPASGPVHHAVEAALADSAKEQSALHSALGSGNPASIQAALADNGKTEAALRHALAQAPSSGPLHNSLESALGEAGKTKTSLQHALADAVPGGKQMQSALAENTKAESMLHRALASGQIPKTGPLHNSVQSALADSKKAQTALDHALSTTGRPSEASLQQALTDNRAAQAALRKALSSGQVPKSGPLHNELESALADSRQVGKDLNQALTSSGVPVETGNLLTSSGLPATSLGGLGSVLGSGKGLSANLGSLGGGSAGGVGGAGAGGAGAGGVGGAAGVNGLSGAGLSGGAGGLSSGRFVSPGTGAGGSAGATGAPGATAESGAGGIPMYSPMAGGGMGGMGGQQQGQNGERERTTWLAEDEDVWGTDPDVGPAVLGRDLAAYDDADDFDDYAETAPEPSRTPGRARTR
jgi:hypothetical protein